MFKPKNALISLAVVALLAACGGGGGGNDDDNGNPNNNPPPTTQQPGDQSAAATADTQWTAGTFNLSGPGVVIGTSETAVQQRDYTAFTSTTDRGDGTGYGLYGQDAGENAPIEKFGLSFSFAPATPGTASTSVGRIAFEMADQVASGATDPTNALRILVDNVTYAVDAGNNVTVTLGAESKVYVYAKNGTGSATVSTTATDLVSVVQNPGGDDTTRFAIVLDVDKAVTDALAATTAGSTENQVLESVKTFEGTAASPLKTSIVYSNLNVDNAGADLAGPTISFPSVAGVRDGSGVSGFVQGKAAAPATP